MRVIYGADCDEARSAHSGGKFVVSGQTKRTMCEPESKSGIPVKLIAADSDKLFRFAGGQCDRCTTLSDIVRTRRHYPIFPRVLVRATKFADD